MPKDEKGFDWEKLKTDPKLWMRLTAPVDENNTLDRIFKGDENPFEKDGAALARVKRLASEGKLYVREYGRASHFQKVEMDGDNPKLGSEYELRLNGGTDPVAGFLMRLSRSYFKWIGLNSISNWFDKRLKQREENIKYDEKYRKEFKEISKREKKEIKAQKKQEKLEQKAQKKLDKLKKELEKAQEELDQIQGKSDTKSKDEMETPLSTPPVTEQQNTLQPTLLGDTPVQNQQTQPSRNWNLSQQHTVSHEISGQKKPETKSEPKKESKETTKEPDVRLMIDGKEYTKNDLNVLPEDVKRALELITAFIAQQKEIEASARQNQITNNPQPVQEQTLKQEPIPLTMEHVIEHEVSSTVGNEVVQEIPQTNANEVKPEEQPQVNVQQPQEQIAPAQQQPLQENAPQTEVTGEVNKVDIASPLAQPADLEPDKISMQKPLEQQEPVSLQQRLAEEAQAMDAAINWQDTVVKTLLSHPEAKPYMDNYQAIKDQGNLGMEYLAGVTFGALSKAGADPEKQQQVLEGLLSGKSLGSENDSLVSNGVSAYNRAMEQVTQGDKQTMAQMLADSIQALSQQASRETGASARNVMIGKLIGAAAKMATEKGVELPLNEDEMTLARGAATMADLGVRYHNAKQYLSQDPMDITSMDGRAAVRDLLAGKAIEMMVADNHKDGEQITATHMVMGQGMWELDNLLTMTRDTPTCQRIKPEQVKAMIEKPDGYKAAKVVHNVTTDLLAEAMEIQKGVNDMQKQLQNENQLEQPTINALQQPM